MLNNQTIPTANEMKYIGLTLDKRLTWIPYIKLKLWSSAKPFNTETLLAFQSVCLRLV